MKRVVIILLLSSMSFHGFNQNYSPLLEDENTWNVLSAGVFPFPYFDTVYSTISYKVSGDSTINAISYKKIFTSTEEIPVNWNLYGFMREDTNGKVWARMNINDEDWLMYDFSVVVGDTVFVGQYEPVDLIVDSITVVSINGDDRNKYWFSCFDNPYYHEYWIEGIGSNQGIVWSGSAMIVGGFYRILCMSNDDELQFMNPEFGICYLNTVGLDDTEPEDFTVYPIPAKEMIRINYKMDLDLRSVSITDLSGRLVKRFDPGQKSMDISSLPEGVYMLNVHTTRGQYQQKLIVAKP